MPYAVQQNLIDRFSQVELIQLTDKGEPPTGAIVVAVLNKALADADGEIDGYLVGVYQLPLPSVPKNLEMLACDIARYKLYDDRCPEHVQKRYDDAVKYLRSVAKGEISLSLDALNAEAPQNTAAISGGQERTFDRDKLTDYL